MDVPRRQRRRRGFPLRHRRRPHRRRPAGGVRVRGWQGEPARTGVRVERGRLDRGPHGGSSAAGQGVGRVRAFRRRLRGAVLLCGRQPRHEQRGDGRDLARPVRPFLLPLRLQGRVVPGVELRAVRHGARSRNARAGAVDASRAARLRGTDAARVPQSALDHRARPPAALGLSRGPARRLAEGGSDAGRARLHGVRRPLPPLCEGRSPRPQVHHPRHHRRRQQSARFALRRVRPCGVGDHDGPRPARCQPAARRHPRRERGHRKSAGGHRRAGRFGGLAAGVRRGRDVRARRGGVRGEQLRQRSAARQFSCGPGPGPALPERAGACCAAARCHGAD